MYLIALYMYACPFLPSTLTSASVCISIMDSKCSCFPRRSRWFLLYPGKEIIPGAGCLCQSSSFVINNIRRLLINLTSKSLQRLILGGRSFSCQKLKITIGMLVPIQHHDGSSLYG